LFTERYPGKLCALCNLSERSTLGQVSILILHFLSFKNNCLCRLINVLTSKVIV
jgi:hypothetical protein